MFEFCITTLYILRGSLRERSLERMNFIFHEYKYRLLWVDRPWFAEHPVYRVPRAYTYLLAVRGKARGCRVKTRNTRVYGPARSNRATGISSRFLRRLKRRRHFVPLAVRLLLKLPSRVPFSTDVIHTLGL